MRRLASSASGGVISNQICVDSTYVSAAHPAFFSNRHSIQGLPHKQVI